MSVDNIRIELWGFCSYDASCLSPGSEIWNASFDRFHLPSILSLRGVIFSCSHALQSTAVTCSDAVTENFSQFGCQISALDRECVVSHTLERPHVRWDDLFSSANESDLCSDDVENAEREKRIRRWLLDELTCVKTPEQSSVELQSSYSLSIVEKEQFLRCAEWYRHASSGRSAPFDIIDELSGSVFGRLYVPLRGTVRRNAPSSSELLMLPVFLQDVAERKLLSSFSSFLSVEPFAEFNEHSQLYALVRVSCTGHPCQERLSFSKAVRFEQTAPICNDALRQVLGCTATSINLESTFSINNQPESFPSRPLLDDSQSSQLSRLRDLSKPANTLALLEKSKSAGSWITSVALSSARRTLTTYASL